MIPSWGKPDVYIKKIGTSLYYHLYTPINNTCKLTPTKGTKQEAKIEGGEVEAVRYGKNTYLFELEILQGNEDGSARTLPFEHFDGKVVGEWEIIVIPENPEVEGPKLDRTILSIEDSFDAENGAKWKISADVLKPTTGNSVKWQRNAIPTDKREPGDYITLTSFSIESTKSVAKDAVAAIKPTFVPSTATPVVTWSSANSSVATVDEFGHVTGVKAGSTKITATAQGKSSECTVTVTA